MHWCERQSPVAFIIMLLPCLLPISEVGAIRQAAGDEPRSLTSPDRLDVLGIPDVFGVRNVTGADPVLADRLDGSETRHRTLRDIPKPEQIRHLWIGSGPVRDSDLVFLRGAPRIEGLWLPGFWSGPPTKLCDGGLNIIGSVRSLVSLSITSDSISDAGVGQLAQLNNLLHLQLRSQTVTDACIAHICGMPKLGILLLRIPQMTDNALPHFQATTQLGILDVRGTMITGVGFSSAACPPNLRALLGDFNDAGLRAISRTESLSLRLGILVVAGPNATDEGVAHLTSMNSLRHLEFHDTLVTEQRVRELLRQAPRRLKVVTLINGKQRRLIERQPTRGKPK